MPAIMPFFIPKKNKKKKKDTLTGVQGGINAGNMGREWTGEGGVQQFRDTVWKSGTKIGYGNRVRA